MNPVCTVMVGLPALGKSTFIKSIKTADTWIYSTDMFIETVAEDNGITYDEAFLSNIDAAIKFNEQKIETIMMLRKDIIWDQTNLGVGKRKKIVERMAKVGYTVNCICLQPHIAGKDWLESNTEWNRRLSSRSGKNIPQHVLTNMMENFVVPTLDEGFDSIIFYDMVGQPLGYLYKHDN